MPPPPTDAPNCATAYDVGQYRARHWPTHRPLAFGRPAFQHLPQRLLRPQYPNHQPSQPIFCLPCDSHTSIVVTSDDIFRDGSSGFDATSSALFPAAFVAHSPPTVIVRDGGFRSASRAGATCARVAPFPAPPAGIFRDGGFRSGFDATSAALFPAHVKG